MGYLACKKCGGIYELEPGESYEDLKDHRCSCGGKLQYAEEITLRCRGCEHKNKITSKNCEYCGRPLFEGGKPPLRRIELRTIERKNYGDRISGIIVGGLICIFSFGLFQWIYSGWYYFQDNLGMSAVIIFLALILFLIGMVGIFKGMNALNEVFDNKKVKEN